MRFPSGAPTGACGCMSHHLTHGSRRGLFSGAAPAAQRRLRRRRPIDLLRAEGLEQVVGQANDLFVGQQRDDATVQQCRDRTAQPFSAAAAAMENSPWREPWVRKPERLTEPRQGRWKRDVGYRSRASRTLMVRRAPAQIVCVTLPTPLPGLVRVCPAFSPTAHAVGYFPTPLPRLNDGCAVSANWPTVG
jgi:hypothetical protein